MSVYCRLSLRESALGGRTFAEQTATLVDERGPSLSLLVFRGYQLTNAPLQRKHFAYFLMC